MDGVKHLVLRVYGDDGTGFQDIRLKPEAGMVFTADGIEKAKSSYAEILKKAFPHRLFRFVRVTKNRVNVIPA